MGMVRAGNGFPPPATGHDIFSVHTADPYKGAMGFFYSTHFYRIQTLKLTCAVITISRFGIYTPAVINRFFS